MDILDNLFGGPARVKLLKLFMLNPKLILPTKEVSKRSKVSPEIARRELALLKHIGFVRQRATLEHGRKTKGWQLDESFPILRQLEMFLMSDRPLTGTRLARRFKNVGRIKLIISAGVFLGREDSRADLLIVGDRFKSGRIDTIVKKIEAETGRELKYAVCETADFNYRYGAYDKFIRDILDYPHEKVINRLGLE